MISRVRKLQQVKIFTFCLALEKPDFLVQVRKTCMQLLGCQLAFTKRHLDELRVNE